MVEYERTSLNGSTDKPAPRICIVGLGGAGSNVIDRITLDRIVEATLVCMHTDVRVLSHSMAPVKVQLGVELMKGIGAGGDPDLGREAALFSREQIRQAIEGHDIIFLSAGLGGGSGSGAVPVVAEIAKNTGALVLVIASMPFAFEGRRRIAQAEEALELLQKRADALILFENNRMGELVLPKDGIQKAFTLADQLIAQCVRAVATITATPGIVKLGLDDLTAALRTTNGRCLFGFGEARGQNRGAEALKKALKSPLIDQGRLLHQTETLLVHVAGGETLTLVEVEGIMKQLGRNVPDRTHILFGLAVDAKLGDSVAVTLISSLGIQQLNAHAAAAPPVEMMAPITEATPAPAPVPVLLSAPTVKREAAPKRLAPVLLSAKPEVDLLFQEKELQVEAPAPELEPEVVAETPKSEPIATLEEAATPPVVAQETTPETARVPVRTPAAKQLADVARESRTLASVVAQSVTLQTEPPPVEQDDMLILDSPAPSQSTGRRPNIGEQQTFSLGEEDRGRFKDTEPSIIEGEDLDVPTWKRLKMKLKR